MKKFLLTMLLASIAVAGWSFDVDYDYSSKQALLQMGFSSNEMSSGLLQPVFNRNKLLQDNYATMQYEHYLVGEFSAPYYSLFLCNEGDSNTQFGESWSGAVTWTCKSGLAISKVVVESLNTGVASRVHITTQSGDESTTADAITTCYLRGTQNYFKISGNSAIIKKITVSYKSTNKYDITGDGKVDVSDVNAVINIILKEKSTADYPGDADVTGDDKVDVSDVNAIINVILNPETLIDFEEFEVNGVKFKMVKVEGGTFTMGATPEQGSDAYDSEKPAHQVTLSSYRIGATEVTQALWQAVMGSNPSYYNGTGNSAYGSNHSADYGTNLQRPVEYVSWNDCQEFITKLNQLTGKTFRLPTEAEWEYAARGGNKSQGYKYAGSNTVGDVAWYSNNSSSTTHAVGTKQANELGLYDMSGNMLEWCQDWYGSYSSGAQTNPTGPTSGSYRVNRGGSWNRNAGACRVSLRFSDTPTHRYGSIGLRLVY